MAIILWYRRIERKSRNWACGGWSESPTAEISWCHSAAQVVCLIRSASPLDFALDRRSRSAGETVCQYSSSKWEPPSLLHHVACLFFSGNCQFCSPQQLQYFSTKRSVLQLYPDCLCKAIKQVQESRLCTLRGRGSTIAHHACRVYSGA